MRFSRVYDNIDNLPIWNFNKVKETQDLKYLFISKSILNRFYNKKLLKIWENILNQFFKEFGISEEYLNELNEERKILIMICDRWIEGDRSIETFIDKKKYELSLKNKNKKELKMGIQLSILSKYQTYRIDEKETTVKVFYSILENYKQYIKSIQ